MPNPPTQPPVKLDYSTPAPKGRTPLYLALAFAAVGVFALTMNLMDSGRPRPVANRVKCASNLRQIGQAILLYSNDNSGQYPPDLGTLLLTEEITSEVFTCPSSNDTRAIGATTQTVVNEMAKPGHLSYIYLGKGLNAKTISPNTVVAYEPLSNHDGDGSNVLFADGHVEFLQSNQIRILEAKLRSSTGPTTLPDSP